jgi:hypothetical protein
LTRHRRQGIDARAVSDPGQHVRDEAGDVNFVAMWDQMGGAERYDRRRRWWAEARQSFAHAVD